MATQQSDRSSEARPHSTYSRPADHNPRDEFTRKELIGIGCLICVLALLVALLYKQQPQPQELTVSGVPTLVEHRLVHDQKVHKDLGYVVVLPDHAVVIDAVTVMDSQYPCPLCEDKCLAGEHMANLAETAQEDGRSVDFHGTQLFLNGKQTYFQGKPVLKAATMTYRSKVYHLCKK